MAETVKLSDERLNPDALMAALVANHAHKADPGRKGCGIEKAIRAYLAIAIADELQAFRSAHGAVKAEPVAWQWSDFSGNWYTVDAARTPLDEQEIMARLVAGKQEGRVRPLYASPAFAPDGLTADCTRSLPGGIMDDSTYSEIEEALDKIDAPMCAVDGRFYKLAERIAALSPNLNPKGSDNGQS